MNKFILPTDRYSATIAKLRKVYGRTANIQESYIRLVKPLTATNVDERFTLSDGLSNGQRQPTEYLLSQNDNFAALDMAMFLAKVNVDTYTSGNLGNQTMYPYPDPVVFDQPAAGTNVSEREALESLYNGFITIKADSYEVVNRMQLWPFRYAPQTQFSVAAAGPPAINRTTVPSTEASAYRPLYLTPLFEGKKKNEVNFEKAQGADTTLIVGAGTATEQNYLIFILKGFVIRNVSEAVTNSELVQNGILL